MPKLKNNQKKVLKLKDVGFTADTTIIELFGALTCAIIILWLIILQSFFTITNILKEEKNRKINTFSFNLFILFKPCSLQTPS